MRRVLRSWWLSGVAGWQLLENTTKKSKLPGADNRQRTAGLFPRKRGIVFTHSRHHTHRDKQRLPKGKRGFRMCRRRVRLWIKVLSAPMGNMPQNVPKYNHQQNPLRSLPATQGILLDVTSIKRKPNSLASGAKLQLQKAVSRPCLPEGYPSK